MVCLKHVIIMLVPTLGSLLENMCC
uniref:Uncharacterized protein n=1 Tax=Arundo donax TaxID=35708 RepID=A0A0A9FS49_ARUDO